MESAPSSIDNNAKNLLNHVSVEYHWSIICTRAPFDLHCIYEYLKHVMSILNVEYIYLLGMYSTYRSNRNITVDVIHLTQYHLHYTKVNTELQ